MQENSKCQRSGEGGGLGVFSCNIEKGSCFFAFPSIYWWSHDWCWWRNTHDGHHHANGNQAVAFLCLREYCAVGHYGADVFPIIATIDTLLLHSHKTGNIQGCTIKKYITNILVECFNFTDSVTIYNFISTHLKGQLWPPVSDEKESVCNEKSSLPSQVYELRKSVCL